LGEFTGEGHLKQSQVPDEPGSITDDKIVGRILRGRIDDFEMLLNRYRGYVFKIVSGLLPPEAVSEHSHEIFIEVYRSLPKYQDGTIFKKWLAGIAIHSCYDYWRKHYRNLEIPLSSLTEDHQEWIDGVVASQAGEAFSNKERQKEAREILQQAMAGLSAKDRVLLTLVHLEGFSIREAAEILGWSTINVKVRAHRSREKMRRHIAAMLEGGI
jgi:RNA polymerase sigma-70 factor (ECF subfamily)